MRLDLLLGLVGGLCFVPAQAAHGQSLEEEGIVTESSDDRIVVETEADTTVSDGDQGTVFTMAELGTEGEQQIIVATFRVEVVTGSIVVGELTERSDLVDVRQGQAVSFSDEEETEESGKLVIRTAPADARVRLEALGEPGASGRRVGRTPVREDVSTGRYRVTAEKSGYVAEERTVRVRPGTARTLDLSLDPREGILKISAAPTTGTVSLNGTEIGETPLSKKVRAGTHRVTVNASGYASVTDSVRVDGGQTRQVDVTLQRPLDVQLASEHGGPVSGVDLTREGPELVVRYDLAGEGEEYDVQLQLSVDGGTSYERLDESELRGAIGDVAPGANKEIRWAALQRYTGGIQGDTYRLRLNAEAPRAGGFTVEVQSGPAGSGTDNLELGGGRVGWTTGEGAFIGASYTQLGFDIDILSARAMQRWSLGWFHYRTIVGIAYIDGVPDVLSGGIELGSGLHFGKSLYVGGDALYLQTAAGKGKIGVLLTIGVSL